MVIFNSDVSLPECNFLNYWTGHRMDMFSSQGWHCIANHLRYLSRPWKTSCLPNCWPWGVQFERHDHFFGGLYIPRKNESTRGIQIWRWFITGMPPPRKWSNQNHSRLLNFLHSNWLVTLLHRSPKRHYTGLPHQKPGYTKHREHFPWGSPPSIIVGYKKKHCSSCSI
jgi:hypothetical protein